MWLTSTCCTNSLKMEKFSYFAPFAPICQSTETVYRRAVQEAKQNSKLWRSEDNSHSPLSEAATDIHSKARKVTLKFLFATKLWHIWISVCSHLKPHWEWLCWQQWVKEHWVLLFTLRFYMHVVIQSIISIIAPCAEQAGKYGRTNLYNRLNVIRMNTYSLFCYTTINLVVLMTHFLLYLVSPLVPGDLTSCPCVFSHFLDYPLPPCGLHQFVCL